MGTFPFPSLPFPLVGQFGLSLRRALNSILSLVIDRAFWLTFISTCRSHAARDEAEIGGGEGRGTEG